MARESSGEDEHTFSVNPVTCSACGSALVDGDCPNTSCDGGDGTGSGDE